MPPAPANRSETPATDDAPVETNGATNAATASPGGFKAWLPLIIMIVLMPALAYAMTSFVILPKLQKGLGGSTSATSAANATADSSTKAKKEASTVKKESVPINKLLVNVAGTMGARYLLVSLSLVGSSSDFKTRIDSHSAQLLDMAQTALSTKTLADLEKPGVRNMIRNELLSGFNNILGDGAVEEIYFTEFAIQ
jgi:flagellar protein FliL